MATQYAFISKWQIQAPVETVWESIHDSLSWPSWWKGVINVTEIEKGDPDGVGGIREYTWRSILPYQLSFRMQLTEMEKHTRMKGLAFGELEGEGEWFFEERNGVTHIAYHWTVFTNKPWMNYLAFLLKPAFTFNHDVVMGWGAKGLAKKLKAKLLKG